MVKHVTPPLIQDSHPMLIYPELAEALGLNVSIFVSQLHYWLSNPNVGTCADGRRWIKNAVNSNKDNLKDWLSNFPFWSIGTLKRTIIAAEASGVVISRNDLNSLGFDRTKHYTIDYDKLAELGLNVFQPHWYKMSQCTGTNCVNPSAQNESIHRHKMSRTITETNSETKKETTTKDRPNGRRGGGGVHSHSLKTDNPAKDTPPADNSYTAAELLSFNAKLGLEPNRWDYTPHAETLSRWAAEAETVKAEYDHAGAIVNAIKRGDAPPGDTQHRPSDDQLGRRWFTDEEVYEFFGT